MAAARRRRRRILFHAFVVSARAAGTQQSVRVCYHLARVGAEVHLHLGGSVFPDRDRLLRFFGLEDEPRLVTYFHRAWLAERTSNPFLLSVAGLGFHLKRLMRLLSTSEKNRYDVFLARGHRIPTLHVRLKRWLGYKIIYELHELHEYDDCEEELITDDRDLRAAERLLWRRADGVITITDSLRRICERKWGPREHVTVIPSGAVLFESDPLPKGHRHKRVYFIGNFYPHSGIDDLIRAITRVPDVTLTVVGGRTGDEHHARVTALIDDLSVGNRVRLRGFVEPAQLSEVYAEADVLVAPLTNQIRAKFFVSPLKLFEYMSARRPIIASDHPTTREIFTHERNALLTEAENPAGLAAAIRRLRDDADLAHRIAEQAYVDARRYSMDRKCLAINRFCDKVLRGGR